MPGDSKLRAMLVGGSIGRHGIPASKKVKTAFELEEEEMRQKALNDEILEMERKEKERWKRIKRMFKPPDIIGIIKRAMQDKLQVALKPLRDPKGLLDSLMKDMQITSKKEGWAWVNFWRDIDIHNHNAVRYERFCDYFRMTQDMWSRRLFDSINISLTGAISLQDWLTFCRDYLIIDRKRTEEFSFRMVSRRGVVFNPKISIIDLEDIRLFLKARFRMKEEKSLFKNAMAVFQYVDGNGDSGLYIDEYEAFNIRNPVFVRFTHCWQNHLRKVCFGIKYWVEKSRVVVKRRATGLRRLVSTSRINIESEKYTSVDLRDPVIDDNGRPISTSVWVEGTKIQGMDLEDLDAAENQEFQDAAKEVLNAALADDDPILSAINEEFLQNKRDGQVLNKELDKKLRKKREAALLEARKLQQQQQIKAGLGAGAAAAAAGGGGAPLAVDEAKKTFSLDHKGRIVLVDAAGKVVVNQKVDDRKCAAWRGPFMRTASATRKYEEDFSEVHAEQIKKKFLKIQAKKEKNDSSKLLATRAHARLVQVCEDIIYSRKWLRVAFAQWFGAVGMEHAHRVITNDEKREAERLAGKKRMAAVVGKKAAAVATEHELSSGIQQAAAKIEQQARALRHLQMSSAEIAEEKRKEAEAKEEKETYQLHEQILENFEREKEKEEDDDYQAMLWESDYRDRMHAPIVSGRYFREDDLRIKRDTLLAGNPRVFSAANSRAASRPPSNFHQRPRTGEYLLSLPGGGAPGRHTSREGGARPGTGGRPRTGGGGGGRPNTGGGGGDKSGAAGEWGNMFSGSGDGDGDDQEEYNTDAYERDKFFTNEVGETFLFPTLNSPDAHDRLQKHSPGKHYVFEMERPATVPGYASDSSDDV